MIVKPHGCGWTCGLGQTSTGLSISKRMSAKTRLPWFRFWAYDFINDEKVQRMNNEAVGLYVKLLILQWQEGSVPLDSVALASLNLLDTMSHPETHEGGFSHPYAAGQALLDEVFDACFVPHPTLPGRLINPRLQREYDDISTQSEARRAAGRLGGLAHKQSLSNATAKPKHHLSKAQAIQSHSQSHIQESEEKKDKRAPWFETFTLSDTLRSWCQSHHLSNPEAHVESFQDHYRKTGGKMSRGQTVKDPDAAFRTWMRNTRTFPQPTIPTRTSRDLSKAHQDE